MKVDLSDANTAESSPAETIDANATAPGAAEALIDANAAASSPVDEKDAKPANLLDVVKDAIKKDEPAAAASSAAEGEGEAQEPKAEPEAKTPEAQAEADAKLPFHEHPRWKEVVAERNSFREDAGRFREINGFMHTHGLSGEEVTEGFDIMAKLKSGDPAKLADVREYFATRLAFLDDALGNVLPSDLQAKVDAGEIDVEAAQETARLRANDKLRTAQDERRTEIDTQTQAENQRRATATACAHAVDKWEQDQRKADPDFAKKAAMVETHCQALFLKKGAPRNADEAVALVSEAYAEVNTILKGMLPKPQPLKRQPSGSSATVASQPTSLLEAVKAGLEASR